MYQKKVRLHVLFEQLWFLSSPSLTEWRTRIHVIIATHCNNCNHCNACFSFPRKGLRPHSLSRTVSLECKATTVSTANFWFVYIVTLGLNQNFVFYLNVLSLYCHFKLFDSFEQVADIFPNMTQASTHYVLKQKKKISTYVKHICTYKYYTLNL